MRDLGTRNGTYVNGRKIGGRQEGESPLTLNPL
jgi:pSer/pThr/pTyr-binding forkhead associated (FHA) protein